ncbi:MAG: PIN domain-containing protein [Armatimonadetes bacterium]|nr:PIN domain-containing protein [Armatimonadota bacterium]
MGLMAGYLLDTNVLIGWFGGHEKVAPLNALLESPENRFHTSILCVAEFLAGCAQADARALKRILEAGEIEMLPFGEFSQAVSAATLRKSLGLKMPDAIIAATAKEKNLILCTLDKVFAGKTAGQIKTHRF